ncbi:calcium-binding protein [uncultured Lamprocystis sp.]|uniref:calcium-binding protein n=1 Tax=uncultured Lamprocystis sp. TaxID=543132 RepID=UPI0025F4A0DF|nr:calcium-binding protein [uncultured Lamprocystis sp.]
MAEYHWIFITAKAAHRYVPEYAPARTDLSPRFSTLTVTESSRWQVSRQSLQQFRATLSSSTSTQTTSSSFAKRLDRSTTTNPPSRGVGVKIYDSGADRLIVSEAKGYTMKAGDDDAIMINGARTLAGNSGDNVILGNRGANSISGGAGKDTILASDGNDTVYGNLGNDMLDGGSGDDTIFAGVGNDTIQGGDGNDTISAGDGNDSISGGGGNDTIYVGVGNDTIDGGDGNDQVYGNAGNDWIFGGAGNDTIDGGAGSDTIDGGSGNDRIIGGDGNDTIQGGAGNDTIQGGAGNDTIQGGAGNDQIDVGTYGADRFVWNDGDGSDVVTSLGWGDTVDLSSAGNYNVTKAVADVLIKSDNGEMVLLKNVNYNTFKDVDDDDVWTIS